MKPIAVSLSTLLLAVPAFAASSTTVANTTQNPVPVVAQGNTPVTVTNTPAVTVTNPVSIANGTNAPVPIINVGKAALNAFQATVQLDVNGITGPLSAQIPIPSGQRLVIEFVEANGTAAAAGGGVQPEVILFSTLNPVVGGQSSPTVSYNFYLDQSLTVPTQFKVASPVKIYADQLSVGIGYAGFQPTYLQYGVSISGYLVNVTPVAP